MAANLVNKAKQHAGYAAVNDWVQSGQVVGIGSGSTIVFAVERLAQRFHSGEIKDIRCVPTGFQATNLILENKLPLSSLMSDPVIDVAIDGADEVNSLLTVIKGGGAAHFQEKLVAYNAKKFVIIADYRKDSEKLGEKWKKGVPVSIYPAALQVVLKQLEKIKESLPVQTCNPVLRMATKKAGPVVTDDGALILDIDFGVIESDKVEEIDQKLHMIPGVVETGFFTNACCAYFGMEDGSLKKVEKKAELMEKTFIKAD